MVKFPPLPFEGEHRSITLTQVELEHGRTFVGYAGLYDSIADLPEFTEQVVYPAFSAVVEQVAAHKYNVPFLYDHGGAPLATTAAGTLRLAADMRGLHVEADLPKHHVIVNQLREQIERGEVAGMSFGFRGAHSQIEARSHGKPHRRISGFARITDVSPTWNPAYLDTSVELRSAVRHLFEPVEPTTLGDHLARLEREVQDDRARFAALFGKAA